MNKIKKRTISLFIYMSGGFFLATGFSSALGKELSSTLFLQLSPILAVLGLLFFFLFLLSLIINLIITIFSPVDRNKLPDLDFKPLFDHIRNFGISSALFVAGLWVAKGNTNSLIHVISASLIVFLSAALFIVNITDGALKFMRKFHHLRLVKITSIFYVLVVFFLGGMILIHNLDKSLLDGFESFIKESSKK